MSVTDTMNAVQAGPAQSEPYAPVTVFAELKDANTNFPSKQLDAELEGIAAAFAQLASDCNATIAHLGDIVAQAVTSSQAAAQSAAGASARTQAATDALAAADALAAQASDALAIAGSEAAQASTMAAQADKAPPVQETQPAPAATDSTQPSTAPVTYATIALAEMVIAGAGYVRDQQRHVWLQPGTGKTAKVVAAENLRFSVQWG